jgi:hypothetical protein
MLYSLNSCKKDNNNQIGNNQYKKISKKIMKDNLPFTSENIRNFYKIDEDSVSYIINNSKRQINIIKGDEMDKSIAIKENEFDIKPKDENIYYEIETFKFSETNKGKLILYNTFGENDIKILNVQLNSYVNNILVDKLLLDCRFSFETQYFRTFKIDQEKNIEIIKFSINSLEYNESGDIIGEKKNADTIKVKVDYDIDAKGYFIKK